MPALREQGFGEEVQRRILVGNFVLSSKAYSPYVHRAQQVRRAVVEDFTAVFRPTNSTSPPSPMETAAAGGAGDVEGVDVLLTPTAPSSALSFAEIEASCREQPVNMYLNDVMTIPANLAGLPAISVPVGLSAQVNLMFLFSPCDNVGMEYLTLCSVC